MEQPITEHIGGPYGYDYNAVSPLAMQKGLPHAELPSGAWIREVLHVVMEVSHNEHDANIERADLMAVAAQLAQPATNEFMELIRSYWNRLHAAAPTGRPGSLEDYRQQFQTIPLPAPANVLHDDDAFAWWRVAGSNPTTIQRATDPRPLNNEGVRSVPVFADDDLDALVASGRLVVADYRQVLADIEPSDYPDGPKFGYRPAAWFGVPKESHRLAPIAILPDPAGTLQYAPPAGSASWSWNAAKTVFASADDNHQQIVSHLARTHLFVEPFIVATHMELPKHHPVSLLMRPHFEGTIFINWSAVHFLVSKGGGVDQLQAGTIASDLKLSAAALTETTFDEAMVPRGFAAKGFADPVPFDYPYRDDALGLWDAIRDWVGSYLALFYGDDGAVESDVALQRWSALVRAQDGGRVESFPELQSVDVLADSLAAIIYAASAFHAAGNFPQANITAYTPLTPAAGYRSVEDAVAVEDEAHWLDMLPPLDMAALQLRLRYTLGRVHYTQLGRYDLAWFLPSRRNVEVQERLGTFHHKLATVEAAINARNARLPVAFQYPYLLPSQVPQSVNI
jgi:arachidonate 15-lipoxygenase